MGNHHAVRTAIIYAEGIVPAFTLDILNNIIFIAVRILLVVDAISIAFDVFLGSAVDALRKGIDALCSFLCKRLYLHPSHCFSFPCSVGSRVVTIVHVFATIED